MYSIDPRRLTAHRHSGLTVDCRRPWQAMRLRKVTETLPFSRTIPYPWVPAEERSQELLDLLVLSREWGM